MRSYYMCTAPVEFNRNELLDLVGRMMKHKAWGLFIIIKRDCKEIVVLSKELNGLLPDNKLVACVICV